jgi:hypothetical protein
MEQTLVLFLNFEIQVAEASEAKLGQLKVVNIRQDDTTDPFLGYVRQIIITTEDDPGLIQLEFYR